MPNVEIHILLAIPPYDGEMEVQQTIVLNHCNICGVERGSFPPKCGKSGAGAASLLMSLNVSATNSHVII